MRDHVRAFVEIAARALELQGPVYEFGSFLVQGQQQLADLRPLFPGREYIGCDLRPGPGVDRIEDVSRLTLSDRCAQTVISVDTLEHVFEARRAVDEMIRILAPGGVLLIAAPMDFRVHDYPADYWRLTPECVARLLAPLEATLIGSQGMESFPHTVFGVGCKTPISGRLPRGMHRLVEGYQTWLDQQQARQPWRRRVKSTLAQYLLYGKGQRRRQAQYHTARFSLNHRAPARFERVDRPSRASLPAVPVT